MWIDIFSVGDKTNPIQHHYQIGNLSKCDHLESLNSNTVNVEVNFRYFIFVTSIPYERDHIKQLIFNVISHKWNFDTPTDIYCFPKFFIPENWNPYCVREYSNFPRRQLDIKYPILDTSPAVHFDSKLYEEFLCLKGYT